MRKRTKWLAGMLVVGSVLLCSCGGGGSGTYEDVEHRMTRARVHEIMGRPDEETKIGDIWVLEDGQRFTVWYTEDDMRVTMKSHIKTTQDEK